MRERDERRGHRGHYGPFDPSEESVEESKRQVLPLAEHPLLDVQIDGATIYFETVAEGQAPEVELRGRRVDMAALRVEARDGVTHVSVEQARRHGGWGFTVWAREPWGVGFWAHPSHLKVYFRVPKNVRLRCSASAAKLHFEQLEHCALEVSSDAGTIELEDVHGTLVLRSNAGRIDGRNVSGSFDVEVNAGALRLEIAGLAAGTHHLVTSMGSSKIELARGLPVCVRAHAAMGSSRVEFPSDEKAPAVLEARAQMGSVKVRESSRLRYRPTETVVPAAGPYRTATVIPGEATIVSSTTETVTSAEAIDDSALEAVLDRVARGELSPAAARELLRELGHR